MSAIDPSANAVGPKPRRWPIALLVAFVTGLGAAFLAAPISDWAMEAHHVSTREGGRACAVIAIWMPLAFITGFVVGFLVGLRLSGSGFVGYAKRQIVALLIACALVAAAGGLGWAAADHPPTIDGKPLALDIEVRVPRKGRSLDELRAANFDVALVVTTRDRAYSDMRWAESTVTDDALIVRAWAPLQSRNASREITAGDHAGERQYFHVMLRASPNEIQETWSEWVAPQAELSGKKPAPDEQYMARYRVRPLSEYSPTPFPSSTPVAEESEAPPVEDSPAPAETP